jgi:hypothetical protein
MHKRLYPLTVFSLAGSLFAGDPFAGTWKLNAAKSRLGQMGPAPGRSDRGQGRPE